MLQFTVGVVTEAARMPEEEINDEVYLRKMEDILGAPPCIGVPPDPSLVVNNVYVGTQANAENIKLLQRMKITHVLNCAGAPLVYGIRQSSQSKKYPPSCGISYMELPIEDCESYDIRRHFRAAHTFIERGCTFGRVLIHCTGVSRCGAICISYMISRGVPLLRATQNLKSARRLALCNHGFMRHLVDYAREMQLLEPEPETVRAPKYGRQIDRARIFSAHLPLQV